MQECEELERPRRQGTVSGNESLRLRLKRCGETPRGTSIYSKYFGKHGEAFVVERSFSFVHQYSFKNLLEMFPTHPC